MSCSSDYPGCSVFFLFFFRAYHYSSYILFFRYFCVRTPRARRTASRPPPPSTSGGPTSPTGHSCPPSPPPYTQTTHGCGSCERSEHRTCIYDVCHVGHFDAIIAVMLVVLVHISAVSPTYFYPIIQILHCQDLPSPSI